jgi:hypothetical protein
MSTLCRAYATESDARAAVGRLLLAGVAREDITVFTGAVERDACDSVTTYPGGVAGVRVGRRDGLERILVAAGREPAAAAADVRLLDAGRIVVLATRAGIAARVALDAGATTVARCRPSRRFPPAPATAARGASGSGSRRSGAPAI